MLKINAAIGFSKLKAGLGTPSQSRDFPRRNKGSLKMVEMTQRSAALVGLRYIHSVPLEKFPKPISTLVVVKRQHFD